MWIRLDNFRFGAHDDFDVASIHLFAFVSKGLEKLFVFGRSRHKVKDQNIENNLKK